MHERSGKRNARLHEVGNLLRADHDGHERLDLHRRVGFELVAVGLQPVGEAAQREHPK